jgi:hypothetical protein
MFRNDIDGRDNKMKKSAWEQLIEMHADGRPICNCGEAYYSPCGVGIDKNGNHRTDMLTCQYGCSANLIEAKEYIAKRVLQAIKARRLEAQ